MVEHGLLRVVWALHQNSKSEQAWFIGELMTFLNKVNFVAKTTKLLTTKKLTYIFL